MPLAHKNNKIKHFNKINFEFMALFELSVLRETHQYLTNETEWEVISFVRAGQKFNSKILFPNFPILIFIVSILSSSKIANEAAEE